MRFLRALILVVALVSFAGPALGAVGLSGGQFQVWKDGSVLSTFTNLNDATWAASVLRADTVTMTAIRTDTTDAVFQVWKGGTVTDTFPTRTEAENFAASNGGDSITMPPQTVTLTGE